MMTSFSQSLMSRVQSKANISQPCLSQAKQPMFGGDYTDSTPIPDFSKSKKPGVRNTVYKIREPLKITGGSFKAAGLLLGALAGITGLAGIIPASQAQGAKDDVNTSTFHLTEEANALKTFQENAQEDLASGEITQEQMEELLRNELNQFVDELDNTRAVSFGLHDKGESFTSETLFLKQQFQEAHPELMDAMVEEATTLETIEDFQTFFDKWLNNVIVPQLEESNPDLLTRNTNAEFLKMANENFSEAQEALEKQIEEPFGKAEAIMGTVGLISLVSGFLIHPVISKGVGKEFDPSDK